MGHTTRWLQSGGNTPTIGIGIGDGLSYPFQGTEEQQCNHAKQPYAS